MRCYRYLSRKYGLRSLKEGRLKLSFLTEFNDLLDTVGLFVGSFTDAFLKEVLFKQPDFEDFKMQYEHAERMAKKYGPRCGGLFTKRSVRECLKDQFNRGLASRVDERESLLLLCTSKVASKRTVKARLDESLLWAHYAECGRVYRKERLVVLDDPISSFDHENKMGVLSYIMFEIENLTCSVYKDENGNEIRPWTKVICLMHELYAYIALAVNVRSHDKEASVKIVQNILALDCRKPSLEKLADENSLDSINEYSRNYEEIFAYAEASHPQPSLHVGNQTRRILEAYSTFVYRKGFEYLFFGEIIKDGDEIRRNRLNAHFRAIFSRFVVNDESHLQGRVRSLTNANVLLSFITDAERQNAIRDSICLLYLINPAHINSLTKDGNLRKAREDQIKWWIEDILSRSPVMGDEG